MTQQTRISFAHKLTKDKSLFKHFIDKLLTVKLCVFLPIFFIFYSIVLWYKVWHTMLYMACLYTKHKYYLFISKYILTNTLKEWCLVCEVIANPDGGRSPKNTASFSSIPTREGIMGLLICTHYTCIPGLYWIKSNEYRRSVSCRS